MESIDNIIFTTWFRVKTEQLFIVTDYKCEIQDSFTEDGIPCAFELITHLVLTPIGGIGRGNNVAIDYTTFQYNVRKKALQRIYAPDNIHQLSNAIMSIRNKYKPK